RRRISIAVDDAWMSDLMAKLKLATEVEVVAAAMSLLRWAADEVGEGWYIAAADSDGRARRQLVFAPLDQVEVVVPAGQAPMEGGQAPIEVNIQEPPKELARHRQRGDRKAAPSKDTRGRINADGNPWRAAGGSERGSDNRSRKCGTGRHSSY